MQMCDNLVAVAVQLFFPFPNLPVLLLNVTAMLLERVAVQLYNRVRFTIKFGFGTRQSETQSDDGMVNVSCGLELGCMCMMNVLGMR